jgi:hypothetical protein
MDQVISDIETFCAATTLPQPQLAMLIGLTRELFLALAQGSDTVITDDIARRILELETWTP